MLLNAKCVYITSNVDERNGKRYASCVLENNDVVETVNVYEELVGMLPALKKYTEYDCTFEYSRVHMQDRSFTVFRLVDIKEAGKKSGS